MRTFKEAAEIFDMLGDVDFSLSRNGEMYHICIILKWLSVLSQKIYPDRKHNDISTYILSEYMTLMDGRYTAEEAGDFIYQTSIGYSSMDSFALVYMFESPYWELNYDRLIKYDDGYDNVDETILSPKEFLMRRKGGFIEDEILLLPDNELSQHPVMELYNMYEYAEMGDDMIGIRSILFPYLAKAKSVAGEEFRKHVSYMEKAYNVIGDWLYNGTYCKFTSDKYGYFFHTDGSYDYYDYGYGLGCLEFDCRIMIAAELIEASMFEIHERYPFLPQEILLMKTERSKVAKPA